ncbi:MAG: response regulator [Desulfamplus sp.]|nr:response regulator [Desulfamplus sp.]
MSNHNIENIQKEISLLDMERERLALMLDAARSVPLCSTFKDAAGKIFQACKTLVGADSGYVALVTQDGTSNDLVFLDDGGQPCYVDPALPMPLRGLRGVAYKTGKPVFENNFNESEWKTLMPPGHVSLSSVMFLPINIASKTIGVIGLANKPGGFDIKDAELLTLFVGISAIALEHARIKESDRTLFDRRLQESDHKYQRMMESLKDPVYIASEDFRVQYVNPAMALRIGSGMEGKFCFEAVHGLTSRCPWCRNIDLKKMGHVEQDIVSPKDNRSYHTSASLFANEDGTYSKITIFRDTTEIKNLQERLQQAQKMESIGTLAAGIAHDFNNILFPIMGHTEMLLSEFPQNSPLVSSLNEIYSASLRARELVGQILTFSRQVPTEEKLMKVQYILKEALKLIRSSIPTTISIKHNIDSSSPPIKADPTQIHQVIMNLTTNAFHAMEENGGVMTVALKKAVLTAGDVPKSYPSNKSAGRAVIYGGTDNGTDNGTGSGTYSATDGGRETKESDVVMDTESDVVMDTGLEPGEFVCLSVSDTGTGIPEGIIRKIFDPFFTTKAEGKGTGMGLSVVHGIVTGAGGGIRVTSRTGGGTVFHVYLPIAQSSIEPRKTDAVKQIPGGSERILIVDDEEFIISMEKQMLGKLGYHVTAFTSSLEALDFFKDNPDKFDLVITDMAMPHLAGDRLALELVKIRPDIPIMMCTGFSERISAETIKSINVRALLLKPVVMSDMSAKIREILDAR